MSGAKGWNTAGERLLKRPLAKETRHGVDHFVPGQHEAKNFGPVTDFFTGEPGEIARVTFVDQMGHACVIVCMRRPGGEWFATWLGRAGQVTEEEPQRAPDDFDLSAKVLAALDAAAQETP